MLNALRESANKWFIKFLLIMVMASFMLWGIVDIIMRVQNNKYVASIGGQRIMIEDLARTVDGYMQALRQRGAKNLDVSPVVDIALKELVQKQLIQSEIDQLGLMVSEQWLRDVVHGLPAFQEAGKFNPQLFKQLLAQNRISDVKFLADLREQLKTQSYMSAVLGGAILPSSYRKVVAQAIQTPFTFASVTVSPASASNPARPSAEQLQNFYEQNKPNFIKPEKRHVQVLYVDVKNILQKVEVTNEEVQALYQERSDAWHTPERREVHQLTFSSRANAEQALTRIASGKNLKDIAKEWSQTKYEESLVEQSQVNQSMADIIFTLKEGATTSIIDTANGYAIYQVSKVYPAFSQELNAELKSQLEEEVRLQKSGSTVKEWLDSLSDTLASGQNLEDIAKKGGFKVITTSLVEGGKTEDGRLAFPEFNEAVNSQLAQEAFGLSVGQVSSMIEVDAKTSLVVSVQNVEPSHAPEYKDIEEKIYQSWLEAEKAKVVEERCRQLMKANSVDELKKEALALGLRVVMHKPVSLMQVQEALSSQKKEGKAVEIPEFIKQIDGLTTMHMFGLRSGESVLGRLNDSAKSWSVIMLDSSSRPTAVENKQFDASLNMAFEKDLGGMLMQALEKKHTVKIDESLVDYVKERMSQAS